MTATLNVFRRVLLSVKAGDITEKLKKVVSLTFVSLKAVASFLFEIRKLMRCVSVMQKMNRILNFCHVPYVQYSPPFMCVSMWIDWFIFILRVYFLNSNLLGRDIEHRSSF